MKFEFDHIVIAGVELPIEGSAVFDRNPRWNSTQPAIALHGYRPGSRRPIGAELVLHSNDDVLGSLYRLVGDYLRTTQFPAICRQWDDEARDRRAASLAQAHEARLATYEAA